MKRRLFQVVPAGDWAKFPEDLKPVPAVAATVEEELEETQAEREKRIADAEDRLLDLFDLTLNA